MIQLERRRTMHDKIHALLVYDQKSPLQALKGILERQGIYVSRAQSCSEARLALGCPETPLLVFTDAVLPDGRWIEIVEMASDACPTVPVIVVSRRLELGLYQKVLESGALDFIIPPFRDADVAHIVRSATHHRFTISCALPRAERTLDEGQLTCSESR